MDKELNNYNYKKLTNSDNYYITDSGELYSIVSHRFLKGEVMDSGYRRYMLVINGHKVRYFAHRLVAEYFVQNPNPEQYNIVNHIDLNKLNNNASNLEWTDVQGNTQHAADHGKLSKKAQHEHLTESFEDEEWRTILNYPAYKISNYGRIINQDNLLLHPWQCGDGYPQVTLHNMGKKKNFRIHRLVYETFTNDTIGENEVIDHIDGDKNNYKLSNLREVSASENTKLAYREQKLNSHAKRIGQFDLNGNLIQEFDNANVAAEILHISASAIRTNCRGLTKTSGGFIFKDI